MDFIDVAAGLVFRAGELLITQRYAGAHLGGLWEFPGGKREPDETFEECLARELREELGIEIRVGPLVEHVEHSYPDKKVRIKFFQCAWIQGEPQPLGCAALAWVRPAQLGAYSFPAADARLIGRLQTDASLWPPGFGKD